MKNKKADIPIIILVLGVVAVCGLAILSFYSSGISVKKDFIGLGMMEKINSLSEEIEFYKSSEIKKDPEKIMEIFNGGISQNKIVFKGVKEKKDGKEFYSLTADYSIEECEYLFVVCEDSRMVFIEYSFKP